MVKRFVFAVPGDLATPTGGYAYDRRMIAELGDLGWQADLLGLGDGFPWPSEATRMAALTKILEIPAGRAIIVDGLALGVLPEGCGAACWSQSSVGAGASSARAGGRTVFRAGRRAAPQ